MATTWVPSKEITGHAGSSLANAGFAYRHHALQTFDMLVSFTFLRLMLGGVHA